MSNTVYELNGTVLTVKPVGELDSLTAPDFKEELLPHLTSVSEAIIDFEKVDYISSAGLRVLLFAENYLENQNANLKIIHINEYIREVFELVGFLDVITVE